MMTDNFDNDATDKYLAITWTDFIFEENYCTLASLLRHQNQRQENHPKSTLQAPYSELCSLINQ